MKITTILGHLWLLMRAPESGQQSICSSMIWKGLYYDDRYPITVHTRQMLERDEDKLRAEFAGFLEALCAAGFFEKQEGRFNAVCPGCLKEQGIALRGDMVICAICGETFPLGMWSAEQVYTPVPQDAHVLQKGRPVREKGPRPNQKIGELARDDLPPRTTCDVCGEVLVFNQWPMTTK